VRPVKKEKDDNGGNKLWKKQNFIITATEKRIQGLTGGERTQMKRYIANVALKKKEEGPKGTPSGDRVTSADDKTTFVGCAQGGEKSKK